jgi:hypothetical protein
METRRRLVLLGLASFVALTPLASAQTTGRVLGRISDATGAALPGVAVTISGSSLQGVRTAVTDGSGDYRFANLPPGIYEVKAELANFKTAAQPKIAVGIDRIVEVNLVMAIGGVSESVTVEATTPVIDTSSAAAGINATPEIFNRLPTRRDFYAVAQVAPGTSTDGAGTTVAGSTGAENTYIIEGLNTTGIRTGVTGKTLNWDFVAEVEVKTGGLPAEYGRMTGGVINVVTKSGGNAFHGSGFGFFEGGALYASDKTASQREKGATTVTSLTSLWDAGFSLGGFILKDRLWFYGAYNPTHRAQGTEVIQPLSTPGSPALGSAIPNTTVTNLFSAKLTYKPANSQTLVFSAFGDPGTFDGNVFPIAGPSSTWTGTRTTGGSDLVGRYDAVFGGRTLLKLLYGHHLETSTTTGEGSSIPLTLDETVTPNLRSGGFGHFENSRYTRDVFKADFSHFVGGHELKAGGDFENIGAQNNRYMAGAGQEIDILRDPSTVMLYYGHNYYVNDKASGFDRNDAATWQITAPLTVTSKTRNFSLYGQDSWRIQNRVTINAGLRWERQEILSRDGTVAVDLKHNWAPRLGAVWDVNANGRSKLYVNWGRFYESIPLDMNIRALGGEVWATSFNYSPDPANYLPAAGTPSRSSLLGGSAEPIDPNLKGQYVDEFLAGYERELGADFSIGVKYAHRNLGRVVEDFLVPSQGQYFIANPSEGTLGQEVAFYNGGTVPAPPAVRRYDSVEFSAKKRYGAGWQVLASYVWSKLEGNYDGVFQASTGQLDPNINSAYDYADFTVNAQGSLTNDRRHAVKLDGSYEIPKGLLKGLDVGGSFHWFSGYPETAYGYSFAYENWDYYLTPRGSVGRGPADWEVNAHVSYPIRIRTGVRAEAIVDVFNLLNRQTITRYDQRFNLVQDGACAGIGGAICNGDGGIATVPGTLTPLGSISLANATNPDFLKAGASFTGPRSIRIGFRVTF